MKENSKKNEIEKIINNIEAVKIQYKSQLASFSYFNKKEKLRFIKEIRQQIYDLKIEYWQRELIIEYLNNDINIYEFLDIIKKMQKD